jgi:hypothetical protein
MIVNVSERTLGQIESFEEQLERVIDKEGSKKVLVTLRTVIMRRIMVRALKFFLEKRKADGILVTMGTPYTSIKRLLKKHGIPDERLIYIDTVTGISNEKVVKDKSVMFLEDPFYPDIIKNAIKEAMVGNNGRKNEFLIIDEISVLLNYIPWHSIEELLLQIMPKNGVQDIISIVLLDKIAHPSLYDRCSKICHDEIEVDRAEACRYLSI